MYMYCYFNLSAIYAKGLWKDDVVSRGSYVGVYTACFKAYLFVRTMYRPINVIIAKMLSRLLTGVGEGSEGVEFFSALGRRYDSMR